jgi:exopolysaccharide biosynthesis polyprenyl glycosylphosphotransferase
MNPIEDRANGRHDLARAPRVYRLRPVGLRTANVIAATAQIFHRIPRIVLIGHRDAIARHARQLRRAGRSMQVAFCPLAPDAPATATADHCRSLRPDSIILLTDDAPDDDACKALLSRLREIPADIHAASAQVRTMWPGARPSAVGGVATSQIASRPLTDVERALKRAFDIVASILALIFLAPLMLISAALVAMGSPGPVIYRQIRHGYDNQPICVLKFRTMYVTTNDEFRQATQNDQRITRIGRLFRMTGIDELPQLINILRGEMSVVGPRPHAIAHNDLFSTRIDGYARRHTIKPGLTGLAQVRGFRGETDTFDKMRNRIECDLYYIDNWSFMLDLQIIFMTVFSRTTYTNAR